MARTDTYSGYEGRDRGRTMKDLDIWLGNSLATILAGLAVASGVIGLLVAFGYLNDDAATPFEDGIIWMLGGLILGICANVFRREHHVVDVNGGALRAAAGGSGRREEAGQRDMGSMETRGDEGRVSYDAGGKYEDPARVPPHTH